MNREEFKKELEERLLNFAVAMVKMSSELPKNPAGFEIGKQIVRAGCSPNANYAEAKFAISLADFTYTIRVCRKELNESLSWMKVIVKAELLPWERVRSNYEECNELISIFTSSIKKLEKRIDQTVRNS
jgi:four helix bundle protein